MLPAGIVTLALAEYVTPSALTARSATTGLPIVTTNGAPRTVGIEIVPVEPETPSLIELGADKVSAGIVKAPKLVPVPFGLVTEIVPVLAPVGTVAVICVALSTENTDAATLLNLTAVAPVKSVPVIVIKSPGNPLVGVKELITGSTKPALVLVTKRLSRLILGRLPTVPLEGPL